MILKWTQSLIHLSKQGVYLGVNTMLDIQGILPSFQLFRLSQVSFRSCITKMNISQIY